MWPAQADLGIVPLRAALTRGEFSCETLCTALLRRCQEYAHYHAFISLDPEQVLAQARAADRHRAQGGPLGELHGVPLAIKDNIHVAGLPNSAGTPSLRTFMPRQDHPAVARLKAAGALVLGKANMHELAVGVTSNNAAFGAVANPLAAGRIAGGSSGGTACAIAAGLVSAGLGTDTGGSVRIPAALTGICGLRPTTGRYPQGAVTPISRTRDTVGPMAASVADLALLDAVITQTSAVLPEVSLEGLRIGIARDYFYARLDRRCQAATAAALALLEDAGAILIEADIPHLQALNEQAAFAIAFYELLRDMPEYLAQQATGVSFADLVAQLASADVRALLQGELGRVGVSRQRYEAALQARQQMIAAYRHYFAQHRLDLIALPTTLLPAAPLGEDESLLLNGVPAPTFATYIHNGDPTSLIGCPGLTLPIGLSEDGLPIGLELDAMIDDDRRLLAIGAALESLLANTSLG